LVKNGKFKCQNPNFKSSSNDKWQRVRLRLRLRAIGGAALRFNGKIEVKKKLAQRLEW
jgi:hypothetical protein